MERDWKELFRWFHRHPEIGFQEWETTAKIKEVLQEEGIPLWPAELKTGVIARIEGGRPGKNIALRADIDALPVEENTGLAYASEYPGRMHACGHDVHITTALYTAALLNRRREQLSGNLYVIFQPAEELAGGAEYVLQNGNLPELEEVYGFHVEPTLKPGEISIQAGCVMAAVDEFRVEITGKGTHGATPELGANPIPAAVSAIEEIGHIIPERLSPLHANVISVTHMESGSTWNVIPDQAFFEGTARTMDPEDRRKIQLEMERIVRNLGQRSGIHAQLLWKEGPAAVINREELCRRAEALAPAHGLKNRCLKPAMTGDDFSRYVAERPGILGLYLKVGTGPGENLHSDHFQADISALEQTGGFLAELLERACTASET